MRLKKADQLDRAEVSLKYIIKNIPFLPEVVDTLHKHDIRYGMYSGSVVAITTSYRNTADVDLLVQDADMHKLRELFPFANSVDIGLGKLMYIGPKKEIEFSTMADIKVGRKVYPFRLTPLAWKNTVRLIMNKKEYFMLNPVDTILLKCMLQRGKTQGKHDLEDIKAIIDSVEIDRNYLRKRLLEIKADERIYTVLKKFKLLLKEY